MVICFASASLAAASKEAIAAALPCASLGSASAQYSPAAAELA